LVVLSDGNENVGRVADEARLAVASGVPISHVVLGANRGTETVLRRIGLPGSMRDGDTFALHLTIDATVETTTRIHVLVDGRLLGTHQAALNPGTNTIVLPQDALPPGFHTIQVQLDPALDTIAENNEMLAYTFVDGRPRVLIVEGAEGEGRFLADALATGGLDTERRQVTTMPLDLADIRRYDSVALVNVPALSLAPAHLRTLKTYVQAFGGGLMLVGGEDAFALGGYRRTILEEVSPVQMERRGSRAASSSSMVLVVDVSGSMSETVGGITKLDLAKEAVLNTLDLLTSSDQLGIVLFDDKTRWLVGLDVLDRPQEIAQAVRGVGPGGGTNIYPALEAAYDAFAGNQSKVKHIILLSDGISPGGEYDTLLQNMHDRGITLSTVGIGLDADRSLMRRLAEDGRGRYYDGSDALEVPQILAKETIEVARTAVVEEPFVPVATGASPILDGIAGGLPPLYGYVASSPKPNSVTILASSQLDPILSEWQYGLGQVVAWTSDAKNRWGADWVEWPEFSRFWTQVAKRTIPSRTDQNLQVSSAVDGARARITVDALADDGGFRNQLPTEATVIRPDGSSASLRLDQVGPGRYAADLPVDQSGAYLLQVVQRDADSGSIVSNQTSGFVTSSAPEYWQLMPNRQLLAAVARATGGRELSSPAEAMLRDVVASGTGRALWPDLAALAVLVLLLDVALRRLRIPLAGIKRVAEKARGRLAWRPTRRPLGSTLPGQPAPQARPLLAISRAAAARRAAAVTVPQSPRAETGGDGKQTVAAGAGARGLSIPRREEQPARPRPASAERPRPAPAPGPAGATRPGAAPGPTGAAPPARRGQLGSRLIAAKQRAGTPRQ
jgi:Ca-activated chloride channel homolog